MNAPETRRILPFAPEKKTTFSNRQFLWLVSGKGKVVIPPFFYSKTLDRPTFWQKLYPGKHGVFLGGMIWGVQTPQEIV